MHIDAAQELKASLMSELVTPLSAATRSMGRAAARGRAMREGGVEVAAHTMPAETIFAVAAQEYEAVRERHRTIALGFAPGETRGQGQVRLAIRVQRQALLASPTVEEMVKRARGEADVRLIGRVTKRPKGGRAHEERPARAGARSAQPLEEAPWYTTQQRPLCIGVSIGHHLVTAGTLGCFVERKGRTFVLSNNHVLANENECETGDAIVQPGVVDGGRRPKSEVGTLRTWVRLKVNSPNVTDCALAAIVPAIGHDLATLRGLGKGEALLRGMSDPAALDEGMTVHKIGRTTGVTHGRVTAFALDNVIVDFGIGNLRFDDQIEIEGTGSKPFSDGGDSGSLIVDDEFRAVALLFAGGDTGGSNGLGLTFANPIAPVLDALRARLLY